MDYIYIVKTISLHEKTEDDLQKEFKTFKINHPIWLLKSYNDFLDFQTSWNDNKYSIDYDDNCYCDSYKLAYIKLLNNVCDINDGGSYNYGCVVKTPLDVTYASSYIENDDITLYKFNLETDCYDLIDKNYDSETKFIVNKLTGRVTEEN